MKSYFAEFNMPGQQTEATVLMFSREISIGYNDESNRPVTLHWEINDTDAVYDGRTLSTRLSNNQNPSVELVIIGRTISQELERLKIQLAKPWYEQDRAKEWGKNLAIFIGFCLFCWLVYSFLLDQEYV